MPVVVVFVIVFVVVLIMVFLLVVVLDVDNLWWNICLPAVTHQPGLHEYGFGRVQNRPPVPAPVTTHQWPSHQPVRIGLPMTIPTYATSFLETDEI